MGKNMMGIEDNVAWATPGECTVQNIPCSETGAECGGVAQNHGKKFVAKTFVDPSVEFMAKQTNLRIKN